MSEVDKIYILVKDNHDKGPVKKKRGECFYFLH